MNTIKAVIFDMDGVIIDSEPLQSRSFEEVLHEYGKQPQLSDNGLVHKTGLRGDDNWKNLMQKYSIQEDLQTLREKRRVAFANIVKENMHPMPGLTDLLSFIQNKHISLAVVSGSSRPHVEMILKGLQISNYFDVVITGEEVEKGKPSPEGFLKAAERLGVAPENCLAIEDSEAGISSAKNAGMQVVYLENKYAKLSENTKPDLSVSSLERIKGILN